MITDMDRPRQIITLLPMKAKDPEETLESLVEGMGPLDIILDCMIDTPIVYSLEQNSVLKIALNIWRLI